MHDRQEQRPPTFLLCHHRAATPPALERLKIWRQHQLDGVGRPITSQIVISKEEGHIGILCHDRRHRQGFFNGAATNARSVVGRSPTSARYCKQAAECVKDRRETIIKGMTRERMGRMGRSKNRLGDRPVAALL